MSSGIGGITRLELMFGGLQLTWVTCFAGLAFRPVGRVSFLCLSKEKKPIERTPLCSAPLLRSGSLRCSPRRPSLKLAAAPLRQSAPDSPDAAVRLGATQRGPHIKSHSNSFPSSALRAPSPASRRRERRGVSERPPPFSPLPLAGEGLGVRVAVASAFDSGAPMEAPDAVPRTGVSGQDGRERHLWDRDVP